MGKILSLRIEFGYWVFTGDGGEPQRPSWNYRKEDGGGIIIDMMCHWQYVLAGIFGRPSAISCTMVTHIDERVDENGKTYKGTADDAAYATVELENGIIAQINSDWCTRVNRGRSGDVSGGWHQGLCGRNTHQLQGAVAGGDAAPRMESGREAVAFVSRMIGRKWTRTSRQQMASGSNGSSLSGTSSKTGHGRMGWIRGRTLYSWPSWR